jgi:hypothetical protein
MEENLNGLDINTTKFTEILVKNGLTKEKFDEMTHSLTELFKECWEKMKELCQKIIESIKGMLDVEQIMDLINYYKDKYRFFRNSINSREEEYRLFRNISKIRETQLSIKYSQYNSNTKCYRHKPNYLKSIRGRI